MGTTDNPVFAQMHAIAGLVVTASVAAAESVWSGAARRACNISGGLHRAMPGSASGFCVYNDVAAAIQWRPDERRASQRRGTPAAQDLDPAAER